MPDRDPAILLDDIRRAIDKIAKYTSGLSKQSFISNEMVVDAVVRNLEVIGEAAKRLPESFQNKHPEIPWRQIAGLRNRIVHHYFGLDLEIVWNVISSDLKDLAKRLDNVGD